MTHLPPSLTLLCLLAVAGLIYGEYKASNPVRAFCKITASTAFVLLAIALNATASTYGQWVLLALMLSWIGDTCLLSGRTPFFLAGLGAFLLAHLAFSVAFGTATISTGALLPAFVMMVLIGAVTLRWLWPHLNRAFKIAVSAYVTAIIAMCTVAIAHSVASASAWVAIGALMFAASDILVAREKFVAQGFINRAVGLPLYFVAQLILAWSIA